MRKTFIVIMLIAAIAIIASVAFAQPMSSLYNRFIRLLDTPTTFTDQADKILQVNAGETAVGFTALTDFITLGTHTTGNYVGSVADGTGIDGTASGEGSTYTPTFDATELDALTWSDGSNASNIWTFDVSGTDHTMTAGSALMTFSGGLTTTLDMIVTGGDITLGTTSIFSGGDTASLNNIDALNATTETTIEAAIDTLANLTSIGTIATGVWQATDVGVEYGGTGVSTLTDGGILLGSGTGAVSALGVLADGSIVVGDGTTDPVALAAFSSSTGDLKHEAGGLEADVSGYTDGIYGMASGATLDIDTEAELETALGGLDVVTVTADDITSANLITALSDETGTGVAVFGTAPTFTTSITITGADASPDAAGEIQYDSTVAGMSGGALRWFDNDSVRLLVDLETDAVDDDYVVAYDAAADGFYMKQDADSGGSTPWDSIGNPTAAATVDFTIFTQTIDIGKTDNGGGDGLILTVTGLGAGTDDVTALKITTTADDDNDFVPLEIRDDSGGNDDQLMYISYRGSIVLRGPNSSIALKNDAVLDQMSGDNYFSVYENADTFELYFGGTDIDITWSDGALNLRNKEDGVDAIVEIEGKDAGEKGILRVLSDGDDKYIELYHNDTDAYILASSGDLYLVAAGGDIQLGDENIVTTGTLASGVITTASNIKSEPKHLKFTIIDPLATQTEDNEICLWPAVPAALTVTKIQVTLDAAANEVAGDLKWADAFIGLAGATVINTFDTTAGVLVDATITAGAVASGKCIYISFDSAPNTAIKQMSVDITWDYD